MKSILPIACMVLALMGCGKEKKESAPTVQPAAQATKTAPANNTLQGEIISWGYGGMEGLFSTITIKTTSNETVEGYFLDEFGEAAPEMSNIESEEYGVVSDSYKGKKVKAVFKPAPHPFSFDESDELVLFTSVTGQ